METMVAAPQKFQRPRSLPTCKVSELLRDSKQLILEQWFEAVESEPELTGDPAHQRRGERTTFQGCWTR